MLLPYNSLTLPGQETQDKSKTDQTDQEGPKKTDSDTVVAPPKPVQTKKRLATSKPATPAKGEESYTLAVEVGLVNLDVVVTDNKGRFIPNLTAKNFRVYEDKVEQKISSFSPTSAPLTVVMLLEFGNTFAAYWDDVTQPAGAFIDTLRPGDWCAAVVYDLNPKILCDFTQDKNELMGSLRRLQIPGFSETNLFDALRFTLDRMEELEGKKAILLVSTGIDTFSRLNLDGILRRLNRTDVTIYSMGLGEYGKLYLESHGAIGGLTELTFLQGENQLKTFASRTGGKAWFPRWPAEYPGIMQQVGIELRNQYNLAYASTNPNKDGKFRKIKVEIVDETGTPVKNLVVRTKEGYQAEKEK